MIENNPEKILDFTSGDIEKLKLELIKSKGSLGGCIFLLSIFFFIFLLIFTTSQYGLGGTSIAVVAILFVLIFFGYYYFIKSVNNGLQSEIAEGKKVVAIKKLTNKAESHTEHGASYTLYFDEMEFETEITLYTRVDVGRHAEIHFTPRSHFLLDVKAQKDESI